MDLNIKQSKQIFTDEFKKELDLGKYTSWVNKLSPEQLQGLFWMIGEVKIRFNPNKLKIDEICNALNANPISHGNYRAVTGLRLFLEFLSGKERTLNEVREEIRKV